MRSRTCSGANGANGKKRANDSLQLHPRPLLQPAASGVPPTAAPTSPPPHHYTTTPLHHCPTAHTHTHRTKCTSNKTSPTWKRAICRNCVSLICVLPATSQLSLSSIHNTACRRSVKLLCKMFHGCNAKSSSSTTITITQGRNITYVHQMGYS